MTGLEIFAAIISIIAGLGTCSKYIKRMNDKLKRRNNLQSSLWTQAQGLSAAVQGNLLELQSFMPTINRYSRSSIYRNGRYQTRLLEAQHNIESLQSLLTSVSGDSSTQLTRYRALADRSRGLTSESLQQLTTQMLASTSTRSLVSSNSQLSLISASSSSSSGSGSTAVTISRSQLNIHGVCPNAWYYRADRYHFTQLATPVSGSDETQWSCNRCARTVRHEVLPLGQSGDMLWASPVAMFKAHCEQAIGERDAGWTCIWGDDHPECWARFDSGREFLRHMKTFHCRLGGDARSTKLQVPADLRSLRDTAGTDHGIGAKIGGVRTGSGNFVDSVTGPLSIV